MPGTPEPRNLALYNFKGDYLPQIETITKAIIKAKKDNFEFEAHFTKHNSENVFYSGRTGGSNHPTWFGQVE